MNRTLSNLLIMMAVMPSLHATEIIAHRGASHEAPENTAAAFNLAWTQQADGVELDVHATKDGKIAIIHDKSTTRTTGIEKVVADESWAELRKLEYGAWKGEQWQGEPIPDLGETIAAIPEGRRLVVEIKCGPEILPELRRVMDEAGPKASQVVLIGFGHETMRLAKVEFPDTEVYWLASIEKDSDGLRPTAEELIAKALDAKVDGLNLNARFAIDAAFVAKVKKAGLKLYIWTVNDADLARRLAGLGVDGITTDRPGWLREQIRRE